MRKNHQIIASFFWRNQLVVFAMHANLINAFCFRLVSKVGWLYSQLISLFPDQIQMKMLHFYFKSLWKAQMNVCVLKYLLLCFRFGLIHNQCYLCRFSGAQTMYCCWSCNSLRVDGCWWLQLMLWQKDELYNIGEIIFILFFKKNTKKTPPVL